MQFRVSMAKVPKLTSFFIFNFDDIASRIMTVNEHLALVCVPATVSLHAEVQLNVNIKKILLECKKHN